MKEKEALSNRQGIFFFAQITMPIMERSVIYYGENYKKHNRVRGVSK